MSMNVPFKMVAATIIVRTLMEGTTVAAEQDTDCQTMDTDAKVVFL